MLKVVLHCVFSFVVPALRRSSLCDADDRSKRKSNVVRMWKAFLDPGETTKKSAFKNTFAKESELVYASVTEIWVWKQGSLQNHNVKSCQENVRKE